VIGQVVELHVKESDTVSRGDRVITLDPESYQAQVDQAAARVRIQEIAMERQRLLISNLEQRHERQESLYQSGLVDEDSFERLENELALAKVDLRSLEESLTQAEAALNQAQEQLEKTRIRSPIDGIVIQIDVKVGETVIAGTTNIPGSTMMVIADPSETLTEVQVDEADIAQVKEGQRADIFPAAHPDTPLAGTVQTIAAVARQEQGQQSLNFLVKILLDEQEEIRVRPGMSVRADIYTQTSEETLAVPVQTIQYDESDIPDENDVAETEELTFVFVVEDGTANRFFQDSHRASRSSRGPSACSETCRTATRSRKNRNPEKRTRIEPCDGQESSRDLAAGRVPHIRHGRGLPQCARWRHSRYRTE
jgi:HlyD family secretion protein